MVDSSVEEASDVAAPIVPAMKIAVPRFSSSQIARARLTSLLAEAKSEQIIMLSAPAGHGKTLLLAEWADAAPDTTAWLTIDADDNDDRRFWAGLLGAIRACPAVPADSAIIRLSLPAGPSRNTAFAAEFAAALSELPSEICLILDDVHELTAADPLHGLGSLIRYSPPQLRLVLATRSDPPMPLGKLRLAERIFEVRAQTLAFSLAEAEAMLAATGLDLRPDQVQLLLAQTEGWAAGMRLAALSMRESGDPDHFLTDLVGNSHAISDYLVSEVLSRLSEEICDFLDAVCVCDQLSAPLAITLAQRPNAGALLSQLESDTSLIVSHGEGRRWFRLHPLLRSHLLVNLRRRQPDLERLLHQRAAGWFEEQGQPVMALRHAKESGNRELLADLLQRNVMTLIKTGQHSVIRTTVGNCPAERIDGDPLLAVAGSLAWLDIGDVGRAERLLDRALTAWPDDPSTGLVWLRALVDARRRWLVDLPLPRRRPEFESNLLVDDSGVFDSGAKAVTMLAMAAAASERGRQVETKKFALDAVDLALADGNGYLAARGTALLASVAAIAGDITEMETLAHRAETLAPPELWRGTQDEVLIAIFLSYGAFLGGRPEDCAAFIQPATEFKPALGRAPRIYRSAVSTLVNHLAAAAQYDLGQRVAGLEAMRATRLATNATRMAREVVALMALVENDCALEIGRVGQAHEVIEWAEARLSGTAELRYLAARGPAMISRFDAARAQLKPILTQTQPPLHRWVAIDAWLLECGIALRLGERERARTALKEALKLASQVGVIRPLVRASPEVAELLADQLGSFGDSEATARLALAGRGKQGNGPVSPLTSREQEVLNLLPSLRSLEEIAVDLTVSLNTVKTHVRSIYSKLGVASRRRAVEVAISQGLLNPS